MNRALFFLLTTLACTSTYAGFPASDTFPEAAVALFEQEIPTVDTAIQKKSPALLKQTDAHVLAFLKSWGYASSSLEGNIFYESISETYPECIIAIDNLISLGLDEMNPSLPESQRTSRKGIFKALNECKVMADAKRSLGTDSPFPGERIDNLKQSLAKVSDQVKEANVLARSDKTMIIRLDVLRNAPRSSFDSICASALGHMKEHYQEIAVTRLSLVEYPTVVKECIP